LYPFRQRKDCTDKILLNLTDLIAESVLIDSGFIEFKKTGQNQFVGENQSTYKVLSLPALPFLCAPFEL
jgi:hypothetical protein